MKCLQWNVNGLRSLIRNAQYKKELISMIKKYDIVALNETKIDNSAMELHSNDFVPDGHYLYSTHATKKGYSGVCIITNTKPLHVLNQTLGSDEGRLVVLEYSRLIVVAVYVPNSGQKLKRIEYRASSWDPHFKSMCLSLSQRKPLLILGDMNVAYQDIDIHKPETHRQTAGFTDIERENFGDLLKSVKLIDTWRTLHKTKKQYTYFDYRTRARVRNAGWRLDYALVSKELWRYVKKCVILQDVEGSDHVPVELVLQLDLTDNN